MQSSMENVEMEMKHIVPNRNEIPAEMDHGVQFQQALNEFVKLKLTPMQATLDTFPDTKVTKFSKILYTMVLLTID